MTPFNVIADSLCASSHFPPIQCSSAAIIVSGDTAQSSDVIQNQPHDQPDEQDRGLEWRNRAFRVIFCTSWSGMGLVTASCGGLNTGMIWLAN
jgi:hypothetical protein